VWNQRIVPNERIAVSDMIPPPEFDDRGNRLPPLVPRPGVRSPEERRQIWRRYFTGLMVGTAVSALVWLSGVYQLVKASLWWVLVGVLIVKLGAGLLAFRSREWRSFGAGIVMSIALGFLIFFFGLCAALVK
jgi:hypothetical protein